MRINFKDHTTYSKTTFFIIFGVFFNLQMVAQESKVSIEAFYQEPTSLQSKNTIVLNGVSKGEFLEIKITGSITNFEHIKLGLAKNNVDLIEEKTLHTYKTLSDQTIVIKTYIPDGIPSEKIKWTSLSGKKYDLIIAENGKDGSIQVTFNLD